MPPPPTSKSKGPLRVLVTGYGPFYQITDNPSWLAVAPLHNSVIRTASGSIQITAVGPLQVAYETVLAVVPGLYAKPPRLPSSDQGLMPGPAVPPPHKGYDFILHVGIGDDGHLAIEQVGHKYGYKFRGVNGKLAPVVSGGPASQPQTSMAQEAEGARIGASAADQDSYVQRGFGEGYERFPENMHTEVDVKGLIEHLKQQGETRVEASTDAGYFLCDFICYCGLAESQRTLFYPEDGDKGTPRAKSLFMHVPSKDTPHSIQEMTEAVRQTLAWVCTGEKALPQ